MAIGGFLTPYGPTPHRIRDRSSPRYYRGFSRDHQFFVSPDQLFCRVNNGAPGRWYAPGPGGVEDRGVVKRDDSVALAVLDSGVVGYFAGIDPWHGPLALQVFG